MKKLMRFLKEEDGVTAVEYAVMVALIAAVIAVGGAVTLGTNTDGVFSSVATTISGS